MQDIFQRDRKGDVGRSGSAGRRRKRDSRQLGNCSAADHNTGVNSQRQIHQQVAIGRIQVERLQTVIIAAADISVHGLLKGDG